MKDKNIKLSLDSRISRVSRESCALRNAGYYLSQQCARESTNPQVYHALRDSNVCDRIDLISAVCSRDIERAGNAILSRLPVFRWLDEPAFRVSRMSKRRVALFDRHGISARAITERIITLAVGFVFFSRISTTLLVYNSRVLIINSLHSLIYIYIYIYNVRLIIFLIIYAMS